MDVQIKKWRWPNIRGELRAQVRARLRLAGEVAASRIRQNISQPTRTLGPSLPGAFPHADTGSLRKSVTYRIDETELSCRVGSDIEYAPYLELGTSKMDARPFVTPTIRSLRSQLSKIFNRPYK